MDILVLVSFSLVLLILHPQTDAHNLFKQCKPQTKVVSKCFEIFGNVMSQETDEQHRGTKERQRGRRWFGSSGNLVQFSLKVVVSRKIEFILEYLKNFVSSETGAKHRSGCRRRPLQVSSFRPGTHQVRASSIKCM